MHATPWRRVLAAGLGAGLSALATLLPAAPSNASTRAGTAGYCPSALGVTVVVDDQDLGAYGTSTGKTTIRCAPPQHAGTPFSGTALQALTAAGFTLAVTSRWGSAFVCRVQGRPAPTETVSIPGNPTYREKCVDTPPASAFWSSWHATNGGTWTYSTQGASTRQVTGGTFEGWSFAHDKTSSTIPKPRVTPKRPAAATTARPAPPSRSTLPAAPPTTTTRLTTSSPSAPTTRRRFAAAPMTPVHATPGRPPHRSSTAHLAHPQLASRRAAMAATRAAPTHAATALRVGDPAAARDWLTGQLRPDGSMPASFGDGADEGLGIDTLWALQATGASDSAVRRVWAALATPAAVDDFTGPSYDRQAGMPDARFGGQSAKLLLAAATVGADVTHVGGRDLRRQTLDLVEPSGPEAGRVRDAGTEVDNTNLIGQALAVMGLAATGPLPADTVGYLLSQQCSSGSFRLYDNDGRSCDAAAAGQAPADIDATAFGVQALIAAAGTAGAGGGAGKVPAAVQDGIRRGLAYLVSAQHADGSFSGGVGTTDANSNSTGLAAATLAAGGDAAAAARAGAWVASLQATTAKAAGTPLAGDVGAIAYDPGGLSQGLTGGGVDADQWRRATAQAVLALSPHTYFALVGTGPGAGESPPPTTPPTTTPPPSTPPSTTLPTTPTAPVAPATHPAPTRAGVRPVVPRSAPTATVQARPVLPGLRATTTGGRILNPGPATSAPSGTVVRHATATAATAATMAAGSVPSPTPPTTSAPAAPSAGEALSGIPQRSMSQAGGTTAPILWAALGGLLLGALVTLRPWQRGSGAFRAPWRRPRGRHA